MFSVGALAEKGVKCDLLPTRPALRHNNKYFAISTALPRMYVVDIIIDDMDLDVAEIYRTKIDAHMWHRRISHCNPRALQQLAGEDTTGVKFNRNIESRDYGVCTVGDSKKSSHRPTNRPRAGTRLEIVSTDVWGPHPVKSCRGCQSAFMFTDDLSRMRFGFPIKTRDETVGVLQMLIKDEADPLELTWFWHHNGH